MAIFVVYWLHPNPEEVLEIWVREREGGVGGGGGKEEMHSR